MPPLPLKPVKDYDDLAPDERKLLEAFAHETLLDPGFDSY